MTTVKGVSLSIFIIFCIVLSSAYAQTEKGTAPYILNANRVPAQGGLLYIYGLNLGNEAKGIKVEIVDTATHAVTPCVNVTMIIPNSIITCVVADAGTGASKHIAITVNGQPNDEADNNVAFSRQGPRLDSLAYNAEESTVIISGVNFGNDASVITVLVDEIPHSVTFVNDSMIVCQLPIDSIPEVTQRFAVVEVDGQSSVANLTSSLVASKIEVGYLDTSTEQEDLNNSPDKNVMIEVAIAVVFGFVVVSGLVTLFVFIRRKRQLSSPNSDNTGDQANSKLEVIVNKEQTEQPGGITPIVRDRSMEEIDLDNDTAAARYPNTAGIYEINESSSSSSSSSLSPFSSAASSPANSPFGSPEHSPLSDRKEKPRGLQMSTEIPCPPPASPPPSFPKIKRALPPPLSLGHSSDEEDLSPRSSFSKKESKKDNSAKARGMVRVPSSRLAHRASFDSPYLAKQIAFDSPDLRQDKFDSPVL